MEPLLHRLLVLSVVILSSHHIHSIKNHLRSVSPTSSSISSSTSSPMQDAPARRLAQYNRDNYNNYNSDNNINKNNNINKKNKNTTNKDNQNWYAKNIADAVNNQPVSENTIKQKFVFANSTVDKRVGVQHTTRHSQKKYFSNRHRKHKEDQEPHDDKVTDLPEDVQYLLQPMPGSEAYYDTGHRANTSDDFNSTRNSSELYNNMQDSYNYSGIDNVSGAGSDYVYENDTINENMLQRTTTESSHVHPDPRETTGHGSRKDTSHDSYVVKKPLALQCPKCMARDSMKEIRLETVKSMILKKLNFDSPPNMTNKVLPKGPQIQRLLERYKLEGEAPYITSSHRHDDPGDAAQVRRIFLTGLPLPDTESMNKTNGVFFNFNDQASNYRVKHATLWLYIRAVNVTVPTVATIHIYKLGRSKKNRHQPKRILQFKRKVRVHRVGGWHQFIITDVMKHWASIPRRNHGIAIEVTSDQLDDTDIVIHPPVRPGDQGYEPYLDVRVTENDHRRSKRSAGFVCNDTSLTDLCCRYPLFVNFTEFGWDFVVLPKSYNAHYCHGDCPLHFLQKYVYTQLVHQMDRKRGPCCTGTSFGSLTMLYFDKMGNVIYGKLPGLVVNSCGCV